MPHLSAMRTDPVEQRTVLGNGRSGGATDPAVHCVRHRDTRAALVEMAWPGIMWFGLISRAEIIQRGVIAAELIEPPPCRRAKARTVGPKSQRATGHGVVTRVDMRGDPNDPVRGNVRIRIGRHHEIGMLRQQCSASV